MSVIEEISTKDEKNKENTENSEQDSAIKEPVVGEVTFEGHKLRTEVGELENGEEILRITSEKGDLPGGVHGANDPMEALISKYVDEEGDDSED